MGPELFWAIYKIGLLGALIIFTALIFSKLILSKSLATLFGVLWLSFVWPATLVLSIILITKVFWILIRDDVVRNI